jgi:hypothetical protein
MVLCQSLRLCIYGHRGTLWPCLMTVLPRPPESHSNLFQELSLLVQPMLFCLECVCAHVIARAHAVVHARKANTLNTLNEACHGKGTVARSVLQSRGGKGTVAMCFDL